MINIYYILVAFVILLAAVLFILIYFGTADNLDVETIIDNKTIDQVIYTFKNTNIKIRNHDNSNEISLSSVNLTQNESLQDEGYSLNNSLFYNGTFTYEGYLISYYFTPGGRALGFNKLSQDSKSITLLTSSGAVSVYSNSYTAVGFDTTKYFSLPDNNYLQVSFENQLTFYYISNSVRYYLGFVPYSEIVEQYITLEKYMFVSFVDIPFDKLEIYLPRNRLLDPLLYVDGERISSVDIPSFDDFNTKMTINLKDAEAIFVNYLPAERIEIKSNGTTITEKDFTLIKSSQVNEYSQLLLRNNNVNVNDYYWFYTIGGEEGENFLISTSPTQNQLFVSSVAGLTYEITFYNKILNTAYSNLYDILDNMIEQQFRLLLTDQDGVLTIISPVSLTRSGSSIILNINGEILTSSVDTFESFPYDYYESTTLTSTVLSDFRYRITLEGSLFFISEKGLLISTVKL